MPATVRAARLAQALERAAHDLHALAFDAQEHRTVAEFERIESDATAVWHALRRQMRG